MIDPRALRTFHAICTAGSISGAARDLNISQPSVSNAIAQLEQRLGVLLFERSRTGIILTPGGVVAQVSLDWLSWQFADDKRAGKRFTGKNCGLCSDPKWKVERKKVE